MSKAESKTPAPIAAVNVQQLATTLDVSPSTIQRWLSQGCPGKRGAYPLKEILAWLRNEGPWRPRLPPGADELMLGDSPALERYRNAKASMAELDLAERQGELIRVDQHRATMLRAAVVLRRCGEQAGKRWGPEATTFHNDMLDALVEAAQAYCKRDDREKPKQIKRIKEFVVAMAKVKQNEVELGKVIDAFDKLNKRLRTEAESLGERIGPDAKTIVLAAADEACDLFAELLEGIAAERKAAQVKGDDDA